MNPKVLLVLRIIFGLFPIVFGSNKFLNFMPAPSPEEIPEAAMNTMGALMGTKTIVLVGIVEIVAGLALLFNRYAALMMIILMSVSINAVMFHAIHWPSTIAGALALLVLNLVMLYAYRNRYKDILRP